jgi:hypothetical protein
MNLRKLAQKEEIVMLKRCALALVLALSVMITNTYAQAESGTTDLKDVLIKGSPWSVGWWNKVAGQSGAFAQSFLEKDGVLKGTSTELVGYETTATVAGKKVTWKSPHGRFIDVTVEKGKIVGKGMGGSLLLDYTPAPTGALPPSVPRDK